MDTQFQTQDDPTVSLIKARLAQRAAVNPLVTNVLNAGRTFFGGKPQPDQLTQNLQGEIGLNQLRTSTPEFELQKAQALANMGVLKDVMAKQLEVEQARKMAAQDTGDTTTPTYGPTLPPSGSMPSSTPAFVQGVGQPTGNSQSTPSADGGDYEAINKPPVKRWNPQTMSYINAPEPAEIKPTIKREAAGKAASEMATEQVKSNKQFGEATGLAQNYIGAIKAADQEAHGGGLVPGTIAKLGAKLNLGFPATAALEQPQTDLPTKMTQILTGGARGGEAIQGQLRASLPDVTNPQSNQAAKFQTMLMSMYSIAKATNDLSPEQRATMSPQDLEARLKKIAITPDEQRQIEQQVQSLIQNTPANTYPKNMSLNSESLPTFGSVEEAEAKGYKGKAIINGVKGTVS